MENMEKKLYATTVPSRGTAYTGTARRCFHNFVRSASVAVQVTWKMDSFVRDSLFDQIREKVGDGKVLVRTVRRC